MLNKWRPDKEETKEGQTKKTKAEIIIWVRWIHTRLRTKIQYRKEEYEI